jgi:cell division cycle 14
MLAFCGPASSHVDSTGFRMYVPEEYATVFLKYGITTVVRLNKKMYDAKRFTKSGLKHHELFFIDGSCPTEAIV